jgi:hypothetical protein
MMDLEDYSESDRSTIDNHDSKKKNLLQGITMEMVPELITLE